MQIFKYLIVGALCLALLDPVDAGWFRRTVRKIGRGIKRTVRKVVKAIKKPLCKVVFGLACPIAVGAAGTAMAVGSSGTGAALVGLGVAAGTKACHVRRSRCRRDAPEELETTMMVPFSDEFSDYDLNGDKEIMYEEFIYAVMKTLPMADPEELREPFIWADVNGDDKLDTDEFMGAPFLFAHYEADTEVDTATAA